MKNGAKTVLMVSVCLVLVAGVARAEFRTIDGSGNNLTNTDWGAVDSQLLRIADPQYGGDGSGDDMISDADRANARTISNTLAAQSGLLNNTYHLSNFVWQWGQFLDHDIDLTNSNAANGSTFITTDPSDPLFPGIPMNRSNYDASTGDSAGNPRQQINQITAYIDASNVYGSDSATAALLRTNSGTGAHLQTSAGNLLMMQYNADMHMDVFVAGDERANEQIGLTAMHTLFMREHNRLADALIAHNPSLTDEQVYQTARRIVGAEMQIITYNEFLPMLLGGAAPAAGDYAYDSAVNAGIANEFSTAMYRFGHTMLSPTFKLYDTDWNATGSIALRDAFFNPALLADDPALLEPLLRGLVFNNAQTIDNKIVDDVRNFLFGAPGSGGMDLASLNIQRGRDHGLADYNTLRVAYGLDAVTGFADITSDTDLAAALEGLYGSVDNIDAWVGALAEDHVPGSPIGELISAALLDQFTRLRDGDRFFFAGDELLLSDDVLGVIDLDAVCLSQIIMWNTSMTDMPLNAFVSMIPEPASAALLAPLALLAMRRRRR